MRRAKRTRHVTIDSAGKIAPRPQLATRGCATCGISRSRNQHAAERVAQTTNHWVAGNTYRYRCMPAGNPGRYGITMRQQPGSGHVGTRLQASDCICIQRIEQTAQLFGLRGYQNKAFIGRPLLDRKQMLHRCRIIGVATQAPHCLGGVSNHSPTQ